jgi:putative protease
VKQSTGLRSSEIWWWLPPVIWPETETAIASQVNLACEKGGHNFVLNTPWQLSLFPKSKKLNLWAGPFCNLANPLAISTAASLGFNGAFVSPELGRDDLLDLPRQSPLPLGIVIAGNWPLCVSRVIAQELKPDKTFASPKGEQTWITKYDNDFWVYPNWQLDLLDQKKSLLKAGYVFLAELIEPLPIKIKLKKRPGLWNWNTKLR